MKINRNNYESFFLDYLEGNLSKADVAMVEKFISLNPDLKEELRNFEIIDLNPDKEEFTGKKELKKSLE